MNILIVGLIVYSIVTTCYLFGMAVNNNSTPFMHTICNGILSVVIFAVVMGIIKVFIYFQ